MWRLSDRDQLGLELDEEPPRNAEELRIRLRRLGLGSQCRVRLTTNRTVVVSHSGGELRIHHSFLGAGEEVWKAIIIFVHGRSRAARQEARRTILQFPVARADADPPRKRRSERANPADAPLIAELSRWHQAYNEERFAGALGAIPIRVSRRMKSRSCFGSFDANCWIRGPSVSLMRRSM